jgi:hypothetical protein
MLPPDIWSLLEVAAVEQKTARLYTPMAAAVLAAYSLVTPRLPAALHTSSP